MSYFSSKTYILIRNEQLIFFIKKSYSLKKQHFIWFHVKVRLE